jgi:hypothetical protein
MSITTIARQAQGMRAGQVIAKLTEDTYFMRVDNRVAQAPPSGSVTTKPQVAVQTSVATVLERSYLLTPTVLRQQLVDPLKVATVLVVTGRLSLTAILAVEAAMAGAPTMGLTGELGAVATAAAEATRTAMSPVRREARPSAVAQMLRPLYRER